MPIVQRFTGAVKLFLRGLLPGTRTCRSQLAWPARDGAVPRPFTMNCTEEASFFGELATVSVAAAPHRKPPELSQCRPAHAYYATWRRGARHHLHRVAMDARGVSG
jgi:hypothetical protein